MGYKTVQDRFWISPETRCLKPEEKLLILNLKTHPHSHYSGIYHVEKESIAGTIGYPLEEIQKLIDTLSKPYQYPPDTLLGTSHADNGQNGKIPIKDYLVLYDDIYQIVFIVDMLTDQTDGKLSQNQIKGVAKHIGGLPPSYLIGEFLKYYDRYKIKKFLPEQYPIQHFSEGGNNSSNNNKDSNNTSSSKNNSNNSEAANSAAVRLKIPDKLIKPLRQAINDLMGLDFNPSQYLWIAFNKGVLIGDSVSVLISMAKTKKSGEPINNPWGYVTNALKNINSAYKISEALKEHERNKEEEMKITSDILEYILTHEPAN